MQCYQLYLFAFATGMAMAFTLVGLALLTEAISHGWRGKTWRKQREKYRKDGRGIIRANWPEPPARYESASTTNVSGYRPY